MPLEIKEDASGETLTRLLLHFLEQTSTDEAVTLAQLCKRFNVSFSLLTRKLHTMSDTCIAGQTGAAWVTLNLADTNRPTTTLTEKGREAAQNMAATISLSPVKRFQLGDVQHRAEQDFVSNEQAIALVFNGVSHAVMMATPSNLVELARGFALSEGIIDSAADWRGAEVLPMTAAGCEVKIEISPRCFDRLKTKRRNLAGATGCGLCGVESLEALAFDAAIVSPAAWVEDLDVEIILKAVAALPAYQLHNCVTGSLHAAAWATPEGNLVAVLEDVGRHNALDKLLGALSLQGQAPSGFVVMSSRASVELVRKCARLKVPVLAVISAPTSMAIQLAHRTNLQLWGMCRPPAAVRYN